MLGTFSQITWGQCFELCARFSAIFIENLAFFLKTNVAIYVGILLCIKMAFYLKTNAMIRICNKSSILGKILLSQITWSQCYKL
jgi:hypothetical protein